MGSEAQVVCVTGAAGFIGSWLVMRLLERGYTVRATVRDPNNMKKVKHLLDLPQAKTHLTLWKADLNEAGSFDEAINGCTGVFHVATPMDFESKDPENEVIKPTVEGVLGIMRACAKAKTVRRLVFTSSAGTVDVQEHRKPVYSEEDWSDMDFVLATKMTGWVGKTARVAFFPSIPCLCLLLFPLNTVFLSFINHEGIFVLVTQMYFVSKTLAEKAAWKFAEENNIDLISIIPSLVVGPFIMSSMPPSLITGLSPITRNEAHYSIMKQGHFVHTDDLCESHIFLFEHPEAKGRYICSSHDASILEVANLLRKKYPEYDIPTEFEGVDENMQSVTFCTKKLLDLGFKYKYTLEDIFVGAVETCREKGLLPLSHEKHVKGAC